MLHKTGAEDVRWDLSCLYAGLNDQKLTADLAEYVRLAEQFPRHYRGKLAEKLGEAITAYAIITSIIGKINGYLNLAQSADVADSAVQTKIAEIEIMTSRAYGDFLEFFHIELSALSDETLANLYLNDPVVAKHRPWIEQIRMLKKHLLSEAVESILTKLSPFSSDAWGIFFDELLADIEFIFKGREHTCEEIINELYESKDAAERAEIMRALDNGLAGSFAKYAAQTLYMVVGSHAIEMRERAYRHPMDEVNQANRVTDEVVEALHSAVKNFAAPLARRFYRLKAAHLGLKKLKWSDRNAPMPFTDTTIIQFSEAMRIVQAAYASFSPTMAELVKSFQQDRRIDAAAIKGKLDGAFNLSFVPPDGNPLSFTCLSYLGSASDVLVLAHECGHGVHGLLAGAAQGTLMFNPPDVFSETASIFGESITFKFLRERLREKGDEQSLLALTMQVIDNIINTTVRQIGLSNFERRLHGMDPTYQTWGEIKKFSVHEVNSLWLETLRELYGADGEVFTYENAGHLWSYIYHFHNPFYLYSYAFGQLLTQSLLTQQPKLGKNFEPLYLDLLRSGDTKNVVELFAPFGINPTDEQFWIDGIKNSLGALIPEAEALSRNMGITIQ